MKVTAEIPVVEIAGEQRKPFVKNYEPFKVCSHPDYHRGIQQRWVVLEFGDDFNITVVAADLEKAIERCKGLK